VDDFRTKIGINNLMYGAAYYPNLQTALTYDYSEDQITITAATITFSKAFGTNGILVSYNGAGNDAPKVKITVGAAADPVAFSITAAKVLTITLGTKTGADVAAAWTTWAASNNALGFTITKNGDGTDTIVTATQTALDSQSASSTLAAIKSSNTALYNQVKTSLAQQRVTLPPGGAIAGIYASVDRDRGVWKAPANVSVSAVIAPTVKINDEDQESLNVDPTAGKSINAIRAFTGKGTLVWGARTLAGNDNEWRYVSVRRLFNMIEESTQKATAFAVFEPNDATTWLKVKAMIESYLYGLWQQGALAGASPDDAYFVNVGLGKTMTTQDVLEGRMVVEIGVAAVRPAEFIILKFTHKLQQA
jgi:phage tail sheath protein FI